MTPTLILWGGLAFVLSFCLTMVVRRVALHWKIVDHPSPVRKIHSRPVPQLGGLAIFVALGAVTIGILATSDLLTSGEITRNHYLGVLLGGLILMLGGFIDDRRELPPHLAILAPTLAAVIAIGFGIEVDKLTNPFGGHIVLEGWQSDMLVFVWLMLVMYTTKFLDGLDGLATSVTSVGALMILLLSLTAAYAQPDVAVLSAVSLGAFLGFLFWNVHPASIFLGEGGSTFVGYMLGVLAVISGGKLATALLVLGIPLLDVAWVVARRWTDGGLPRVFQGDKKHLHHRLLALHWGQTPIVLLYVVIASVFGVSALFLQSREKLVALLVLAVIMFLGALILVNRDRQAVAAGFSLRESIVLAVVFTTVVILGAREGFLHRQNEPTVSFPSGVVVTVDIADDLFEQARGLSGRESIAQNEGLLFLHDTKAIQRYWMKEMNFPIDIIWIDGDTVVGFVENARPQEPPLTIYLSSAPVDKVLEVSAGFVAKHHLEIGDILDIQLQDE